MNLDSLERVRAKQREVIDPFMRMRNVVGVGVGYKVRAGERTDELSITVSVTQKIPASQLPPGELVPPAVGGVSTDVVRTGPIYAIQASRRNAMRPAWPGVSIGHYLVTAGTLGCLVRRDGSVYILSNNHVLAAVNQGRPGDPIYQPGPADGGTPGDQLAELVDYVPLRLDAPSSRPGGLAALLALLLNLLTGRASSPGASSPPPNQVDVALARPLDAALVRAGILEIGVPTGIAEPLLGAPVRKSGRTTGLTESTVQQVDVTADVVYGDKKLRFINQVITGVMSRPGDSGSAVLDAHDRVVGLLFSGSDYVTLFTPITYIIAALGIEVVTG